MSSEDSKSATRLQNNIYLVYLSVILILLTYVILHIIFISPIFYEEGLIEKASIITSIIAALFAFLNFAIEKNKIYKLVWFFLIVGLLFFAISELDIRPSICPRYKCKDYLVIGGAFFTIIVLRILWSEQKTIDISKITFLAFFIGMILLGIGEYVDYLIRREVLAEKFVGIEEPSEMFSGIFFAFALNNRIFYYDQIKSS